MKVNRGKKVLLNKKYILKLCPYFEEFLEGIESNFAKGEKFNIKKMRYSVKKHNNRLIRIVMKLKYKSCCVRTKTFYEKNNLIKLKA